jgi:hypothetical protein
MGRETPTALPAEFGSPQFSPPLRIALRAFFCCGLRLALDGGLPACIETLFDWLLPALDPLPLPDVLEPLLDVLVPPC